MSFITTHDLDHDARRTTHDARRTTINQTRFTRFCFTHFCQEDQEDARNKRRGLRAVSFREGTKGFDWALCDLRRESWNGFRAVFPFVLTPSPSNVYHLAG